VESEAAMNSFASQALVFGGALSALAALAHLACIVIGAPAYRLMGAGERMARAAEARKLRPAIATLAITLVLLIWSAYALSGAGLLGPLPFTKAALVAICAAYIGRALAFPFLKPAFPENSNTFWYVSSGICGLFGLLHLYGTLVLWPVL
jgi:hypothetical protein